MAQGSAGRSVLFFPRSCRAFWRLAGSARRAGLRLHMLGMHVLFEG